MAGRKKTPAFPIPPDDPLAEEHAAVSAWVEASVDLLGRGRFYEEGDLKSIPSGRRLLDGQPEASRRYVLAAVEQAQHWDRETERIRSRLSSEVERDNIHHQPDWNPTWGRRRQAGAVIGTLMRRSLPFARDDLLALVRWCDGQGALSPRTTPIGAVVRAVRRYADASPVDPELRDALKSLSTKLRSSHDKEARRLGTEAEQLCAEAAGGPVVDPAPTAAARPAPAPAPAGTPGVLEALKREYGMLPDGPTPPAAEVGRDRFPLREDSPLRPEHELLSALFQEFARKTEFDEDKTGKFPTGRAILGLEPSAMGRVILAAAERNLHSIVSPEVVWPLLKGRFELPREGLFDLLLFLATRPAYEESAPESKNRELIAQAEGEAARSPLTEGERYVLWLFRLSLIPGPCLGTTSDEVGRLTRLIGDGAAFFLVPGEAWSDAVNADMARLDAAQQARWAALLRHALTATGSRPSAKWLATAGRLAEAIGPEEVREAMLRWLPLVSRGRTFRNMACYPGDMRGTGDLMNDESADALRGLLWSAQALPRPEELARTIASVALSAYKKVPGVGPRAVKVGNAAVYALSAMGTTDAVGQLAKLKLRVKSAPAQKEIEKAFAASAEALGLPRDQIEELSVPTYGLEEVGRRIEPLGDYRAELIITGSDAKLTWFDAAGKPLKSAPARVKSEHKDEWKDLQQSLKDIQSMLPVQRDRIDSLFLRRTTWPIAEWRDRYLDHPLVGTIARRLIWCVDGTPALFIGGQAADVRGEPVALGPTAEVAPWHPVGRSIDEITAWRRRLEDLGITQPFKQAHREVYLLTDAERRTRTYSNRFAAHIIRQHQFHALCAARGWKDKLRLMVDESNPPASRELPQWGLRAEFWVESVGDNYRTDTNDTGAYLRVATDQVRFYRMEAAPDAATGARRGRAAGARRGGANEPMPLEEVPPLVFSEVMRDVDLFVGVASVGNDPTWQDGGPDGRYRQYWHDYAFGGLSGTAATRKQVLERLVPRLRIADRCSFTDRFLVVKGKKRTYRIHLGSGNILMEPNDEYLCIVPDSRSRTNSDDLFLPFEGDGTLSIIISKALLLADDTKIKDPTITQQINRR